MALKITRDEYLRRIKILCIFSLSIECDLSHILTFCCAIIFKDSYMVIFSNVLVSPQILWIGKLFILD